MPSKTCLFVLDCGKWPTLSILSLHREAIIVYKETSWSNAKVGDEVKVEIETNPKSIAIISLVGKLLATFLVKFQDRFTFLSSKKVERLT